MEDLSYEQPGIIYKDYWANMNCHYLLYSLNYLATPGAEGLEKSGVGVSNIPGC